MSVTKVSAGQCRDGYTITADGNYLFQVGGPSKTVGTFNTIYAKGTFGSGTLTFKATPDGTDTNAMAITGGTLTSDGFFNFVTKSQGGLLVVVSGSSGASIKVWAL